MKMPPPDRARSCRHVGAYAAFPGVVADAEVIDDDDLDLAQRRRI